MNLLFVADPLESFDVKKDSTFVMMKEAVRRGHALFACEPKDLMWQRGRPVDLDHAPLRQTADPERDVEPERARRNRLDVHRAVVLAQLHHRALAELTLDLGERGGQGLGLIHGGSFDDTQGSSGHRSCSLWRGFASGTNGRRNREESEADGNLVPCLFYVRNMFFLEGGRYIPFEHVR